MATIVPHNAVINQPHSREEEYHNGNLENQAKPEGERNERGNIGINCYLVHHVCRHLVSSEKTERNGKNHVVAQQHADNKQKVYCHGYLHTIAPLAFIQRRRNKSEKFKHDIGRSQKQGEQGGSREVRHKLRGQLRADELHMKLAHLHIQTHILAKPLDEAVSGKIKFARSEKDTESLLLEAKHEHCERSRNAKNAQQHAPQHFKMSAEGQFLIFFLAHRLPMLLFESAQ